jgi:hypothetical protein
MKYLRLIAVTLMISGCNATSRIENIKLTDTNRGELRALIASSLKKTDLRKFMPFAANTLVVEKAQIGALGFVFSSDNAEFCVQIDARDPDPNASIFRKFLSIRLATTVFKRIKDEKETTSVRFTKPRDSNFGCLFSGEPEEFTEMIGHRYPSSIEDSLLKLLDSPRPPRPSTAPASPRPSPE